MKKRFIGFLMVMILSVGVFIGCGSQNLDETVNSIQKSTVEKSTEVDKNKIKVTIDDIELVDLKVTKPNLVHSVYMETKFKNKSDATIKGITYIYEIDGEKNFLSNFDTILPGEVSTLSKCFGPKSGNKDDAKLLMAEITVINKNGSKTYIEYDNKSGQYKQM